MAEPRKIVLDDGKIIYKCKECDFEVDEDGRCSESEEPCYYCPEDGTCTSCGRGNCDQSC